MSKRPGFPTPDRSELNARLQEAAQRPLTAYERWQQRVSFVYGNLPHDSKTTREDVERRVIENYGPCPEEPGR